MISLLSTLILAMAHPSIPLILYRDSPDYARIHAFQSYTQNCQNYPRSGILAAYGTCSLLYGKRLAAERDRRL